MDRLVAVIADAQRRRGLARVVLTGGSNGIALLSALVDRVDEIDFASATAYLLRRRPVRADRRRGPQ